MNDDIRMKIAMESAKTQKKMRNQFIKDFMETTNVEDCGEEAVATLEYVLMVAYNKGAADALSISVTSQLAAMEGGEEI
mgnify:CR=1 FL=1